MAIQADRTYTVDFGKSFFQVRTIQQNPHAPWMWDCINLLSGLQMIVPARSFVTEAFCLSPVA